MPYARNPVDACRIYFEDEGGPGPPVLILNGLGDPVAASRAWGVAKALATTTRLIYVDHRGHGGSDKPHDASAYTTPRRVADVIAVLDELAIDRAHFIGLSWGGRLCFGIGEHAPERVRSLTIAGQIPYAFDPGARGVQLVTEAFSAGRGMVGFVDALGGVGDVEDWVREYTLANDFEALAAAWRAALQEGDVARHLGDWRFPCLIYAGTRDSDFFEGARRAAAEIPGAQFLALEGQTHLEAHANVEQVLPHIRALLQRA